MSIKTVGLCLSARNAKQVILRCLESVRPFVDYVLVEDGGSIDGTQAAVREWLIRTDLPGMIYEAPYRDLAHNCSRALARLRENDSVDYALLMDAGDQLVIEDPFDITSFKEGLFEDFYGVLVNDGLILYQANLICRNKLEFRYRDVPHPSIDAPPGHLTCRNTVGFHILKGGPNAGEDCYHKDAQIFGRALQADYLARAHNKFDEVNEAAEYFVKRGEIGYWADEVFVTLYRAAQLQEVMGQPLDELIAGYLRASDAVPSRAEGLYVASYLCRLNGRYAEGYDFASRGLKILMPQDGLFVQKWVYEYALLDELSICASWIGKWAETLEACNRLLCEGKLPQSKYDRVTGNAALAAKQLGAGGTEVALPEQMMDPGSRSSWSVVGCEPERDRPKAVLVCGPWGSGTSAVAGLLHHMGAFGIGPYILTTDAKTRNSFESIPFAKVINPHVSGETLAFKPGAQEAVRSDLQNLRRRIEQQEFGPYDIRSSKVIFFKNQAAALFIPEICEVFDMKLIYVMRPLKDIELTRLRRLWLPLVGALGAATIYTHMSNALTRYAHSTMILNYKDLLESPTVYARDMARFAGLDPSLSDLEQAVDFVTTRGG